MLLFLFLHVESIFAKSQGISINIGFIKDNYGTLFYYDEDSYYNDGWHLIDDNGDGIYEYYYFSLSGHVLKDTTAPTGYKLNKNGKLIINDVVYQVSFLDVANSDEYKMNGENLTETIENNVNLSILEPGDLLVCNSGNTGHAEFYVGDGYNVVFIEDDARTHIERKKSGISTITIPDKFSLPTSNDTKAEGTFSWGSVKDEFPVEAGGEHAIGEKLHYFTYNSNGYFQHCECGNNKPTDSHDNSCSMNPNNVNKDRKYTVIWRKK